MKYISSALSCLILLTSLQAFAQDEVLIPENFYLDKGDKLTLHLISANQFIKQEELGFDPSKSESFMNYTGSKKSLRHSLLRQETQSLRCSLKRKAST